MKRLTIVFWIFGALIFSSCVQETHLKTIHFKLDMTSVENPHQVGVKGDFGQQPWKETFPLSDNNHDGIFEGTWTNKTAKNHFQFKFVHQSDQFELTNQNNRVISFEYKPQTFTYEAVFNNPDAILQGENL